jgi:hypothetical protein
VDSGGAAGLAFLDGLSAGPGGRSGAAGSGASQGAEKPEGQGVQKAASSQPAPFPQTFGRPVAPRRKGLPLLGWYIGGGIAAAVLLIVVAVMMTQAACGGGKGKDANVKFGLTESKRRLIFQRLVEAVDQVGEEEAKRTRWPKIEAEYGIDADKREKILDEGFNSSSFLLPATEHYTAQTKANRVGWLKKRNQQQGGLSPGGR